MNKYLQKHIFLVLGLMHQCNSSLKEIAVLSSVCFILLSGIQTPQASELTFKEETF